MRLKSVHWIFLTGGVELQINTTKNHTETGPTHPANKYTSERITFHPDVPVPDGGSDLVILKNKYRLFKFEYSM